MKLGSGEWVTPSIQLLRLLDEGAMGSVWVADHVSLGTEVAVKFVSDRLVGNDAALLRLEAEARAAARLKSPHVVKIFDYGVHEGRTPFFVMEYLEGETLRERLDRDGTLPPRDAALVVTHAARGLHKAHRLGIVHRDIKPDNLFLLDDDDELFVKIVDFGVAKGLTKGVTEPGMLLGTPLYMSREAIVDLHIDHRMDLWALSVVGYEALTGALPFDGETIDEVCTAIWRGTFTPPSELNDELTDEVDRWFKLAFHRQRQERPATAKQLAASFVQAVATIPGALLDDAPDAWRLSQIDLMAHVSTLSSFPAPSSRPPASSQPPTSSPPPRASSTPPPPRSSPSLAPPSERPVDATRASHTPSSLGPVVTPSQRTRAIPLDDPDSFDANATDVGPLSSRAGAAATSDDALLTSPHLRTRDSDEGPSSFTPPPNAPRRARVWVTLVALGAIAAVVLAVASTFPRASNEADPTQAGVPSSSLFEPRSLPDGPPVTQPGSSPATAAPSQATASADASATAAPPVATSPPAPVGREAPRPAFSAPSARPAPAPPPEKDLGF